MARMVVECAVEDAYVAYAPLAYAVEALAYVLYGEGAYGVAHATDTKGTGVEASSGGLYLYEGFPSGKERTLFGGV